MKFIRLNMAIMALVSSSAISFAGELELASVGKSVAENNCNWCHGSLGQGIATAPQLAGQRIGYTQEQLLSFQAHLQDSLYSRQYMWGAVAKLSPQTVHALAVYFSTLSVEAASDGDKGLAATGARIYRQGIPDSNIPSCVPCHGLGAEGFGEIPRLGGQSYTYLKRKMEEWREGYDAATEPPMPEIAKKLSTSEIEALASYLSFVSQLQTASKGNGTGPK